MATRTRTQKTQKARMDVETEKFLEELNEGRLTFGQLLASIRESDGESLAQFSRRLEVTRQHLHQIEKGEKRVSPERALRFATQLGQSEVFFVQLALQDMVNDSGLSATVEVKVA